MITSQTKERRENAYAELKEKFGYTSPMQSPRVTKVVVSTGTGSLKDKGKVEVITDRLARITGQKPSPRSAKKSIATFKTREGDTIGYAVTLRGLRMYNFLDRLIHIALPRTRDFRGIPESSVDDLGNLTIGIREHTIFPETSDEELRDVFGLSVAIVSTARTRAEALAFFRHVGVPFRAGGKEPAIRSVSARKKS